MAVKRTRRTLNALDVSDGGYNFNHFPSKLKLQQKQPKCGIKNTRKRCRITGLRGAEERTGE